MPVSPQDFALWSRMTGNPYPQTPAERMALAPEVYSYTRQVGRQGGPVMSPARRAVDVAGKVALASGLLAGAVLLGGKYLKSKSGQPPASKAAPPSSDISQGLEGEPEPQGPTGPVKPAGPQAAASEPVEVSRPSLAKNFLRHAVAQQSLGGSYRSELDLELDNEPEIKLTVVEAMPDASSQAAIASGDISKPITSELLNQRVVPTATAEVHVARGTSPAKPTLGEIEQKTATQSQVIGSQQHFAPGTEEEQLASAAQPNPTVRAQAEELIGRVSAAKLAEFRQSPYYAATVKPLDDEELIGDTTPYVEPAPKPSVIPGPVRMTPQTRVAVVKEESPIAEMSTAATPATVTTPEPTQRIAAPVGGASSSEIRELDQLLARSHARHTLEQRIDLRNQLLAKKYGGGAALAEAPSQAAASPIVTSSQPQPVRVAAAVSAPEAKISPNEFLSAKSQQVRPAATVPGTKEHLVAQAREHLEGQLNPPKGTIHGAPAEGSSFIENARLYPNNTMGIKVRGQDGEWMEYVHKVEPGFVPYAAEMIKSGNFDGRDYNKMKQIGVLQPHIGSEDLPINDAARADFIAREKARLGL